MTSRGIHHHCRRSQDPTTVTSSHDRVADTAHDLDDQEFGARQPPRCVGAADLLGSSGSGYSCGGETSSDERSVTSSSAGSPRKGSTGPGAAAGGGARPNRKRPTTYTARRDEIAELSREVARLETQQQELDAKRPRYTPELLDFLTRNPQWTIDLERREAAFAGVQSMLSAHTGSRNPLDTFISLPVNIDERRRRMRELKPIKLHEGAKYLLERRQFLDLEHPHQQSEQSTKNGDFVVACFDVTIFPNVTSVRELYEDVLQCIYNQEITMSERPGVLAIRESEDADRTMSQTRIMALVDGSLEIESNSLAFAEFFERSEIYDGEYGILTTDYVNEDASYPYQPARRVRKDASAAILVTACPRQFTEDEGVAVTLTRCAFSRRHRPQCPITDEQLERMRQGAGKWCDLMLKAIKARVAWRKSRRESRLDL